MEKCIELTQICANRKKNKIREIESSVETLEAQKAALERKYEQEISSADLEDLTQIKTKISVIEDRIKSYRGIQKNISDSPAFSAEDKAQIQKEWQGYGSSRQRNLDSISKRGILAIRQLVSVMDELEKEALAARTCASEIERLSFPENLGLKCSDSPVGSLCIYFNQKLSQERLAEINRDYPYEIIKSAEKWADRIVKGT